MFFSRYKKKNNFSKCPDCNLSLPIFIMCRLSYRDAQLGNGMGKVDEATVGTMD